MGSKVVQFAEIKKSVFKPTRKTNEQPKKHVIQPVAIATGTIVK